MDDQSNADGIQRTSDKIVDEASRRMDAESKATFQEQAQIDTLRAQLQNIGWPEPEEMGLCLDEDEWNGKGKVPARLCQGGA